MTLRYLALASLPALLLGAPTLSTRQACGSGYYIIGARGSDQTAGYGDIEPIVEGIMSRVPDSYAEPVDYPATITDPVYYDSLTDGINDTKNKIQSRVNQCGSSTKIALIGFSQGAHVMSNTLAGGFGRPDPIGEELRPYISATVLLADPSHTLDQNYNAGSGSASQGIFHRQDDNNGLALLNTYSSSIQSYCIANDQFCASGNNVPIHGTTPQQFQQAAIDFVVSRF